MSSSNYITSIPVFNGAQGKFYMVDGIKYHICFPVEWAMNHLIFDIGEGDKHQTGPIGCRNCEVYGYVRGVFVGYCSNCLNEYLSHSKRRGFNLFAHDIMSLDNESIWQQYPYMYGVNKYEIGDDDNEYNSVDDLYQYMQNNIYSDYISSENSETDLTESEKEDQLQDL